jgi:hypothetical protein
MSTTTGTPAARAVAAAVSVASRAGSWTEAGAGHEDDAAVTNGCAPDIVDRQRAIGAVVAIERERELVGRLDREDHRAGAVSGLARNEPRLDLFALEKRGHEVADLIVTHGGQQRRAQTEPARADADVCRAAADSTASKLRTSAIARPISCA